MRRVARSLDRVILYSFSCFHALVFIILSYVFIINEKS